MAFSTLWSRRRPERESIPEISTAQLLEAYELIEVIEQPGRELAIVTSKTRDNMMGELGTSSPSSWVSFNRREYNPELVGLRGLEKFDKMRKSDGTVRGTLRLVKTPVLSADWYVEAGGDRRMDKKAADFVWKNFTEWMSISWTQVLVEALLMFDFGYYMFEKVYEEREIDDFGRRNVLKKLAPRHPMDVEEWILDTNGGPVGVWLYAAPEDAARWRADMMSGEKETQTGQMPGLINRPVGNLSGLPNLGEMADHPNSIFVPIEKLLVFTFDKEAGNIEGVSVLRSAYKHWYYKEQLYKIDAIQKERHGIGIPVIKLPMGYKDEDKRAAEELGRNIRTNERAHIVLPPGWEVYMLKLEGSPMDCMKSIEHHDMLIEKNIVGHFLYKLGNNSSDMLADFFLKATQFAADIVAETFNMYCVPQLVGFNYPAAKMPKLRYRHIGEAVDWRTMSFAIRNFIGAGVIQPDEKLEENIREAMGLPKRDPETTRMVQSPQAGPFATRPRGTPTAPGLPRVGPPRQTPVGGQRNTQGLPKGDSGNDRSGGK